MISTHALTWSATLEQYIDDNNITISTHALTWSATALSRAAFLSAFYFNSRTHVECDCTDCPHLACWYISTHALTWSATFAAMSLHESRGTFQLTHSRGVRLSRESLIDQLIYISTHALTWSATKAIKVFVFHHVISTHALTWSATLTSIYGNLTFTFQLTHSRGVRQYPNYYFSDFT